MFKVIMIVFIIIFFLGHLLRTGQACSHHYFPSTCHRAWHWVGAQWEHRPVQCPGPPPSASHSPHWAPSSVFSFTCRADRSSLFATGRTYNKIILESLMHVVNRTSNWPLYGSLNNFPSSSLTLQKKKDDTVWLSRCRPLRDKGFQTVGSTRGGELWRILSSEIYRKPSLVPLESGRLQPGILASFHLPPGETFLSDVATPSHILSLDKTEASIMVFVLDLLGELHSDDPNAGWFMIYTL